MDGCWDMDRKRPSSCQYYVRHGPQQFFPVLLCLWHRNSLGLRVRKDRKVRYTIGFHMLFNLLGGVVTVELSKGPRTGRGPWMIRQIESILGVDMGWLVTAFSSIMILAYLFFMLACLIAAITLIIMYRRQITFLPDNGPEKGRAFQTVFLNVGMIGYFVICCGLFILIGDLHRCFDVIKY